MGYDTSAARCVEHEVKLADVYDVAHVGVGFQESAALVERDFSRLAVPDPCAGLDFPGGEQDGHAVMRIGLDGSRASWP